MSALRQKFLQVLDTTRADFLGGVLRKRGVVVVYGVKLLCEYRKGVEERAQLQPS